MRSGRMGRRLVATAGMGAIIAMGVLSACTKEQKAPEPTTPNTPDGYVAGRFSAAAGHACSAAAGADGEVDQPDRRQPVHASGPGAGRADGTSWRSPQISRTTRSPALAFARVFPRRVTS